MGILDKLFGKKAPSPSPPALPTQIDEMGLHEVVAHLRDVEKPVFADLSQSYRRLLDIALVEHGYEDGERGDCQANLPQVVRTG